MLYSLVFMYKFINLKWVNESSTGYAEWVNEFNAGWVNEFNAQSEKSLQRCVA